MTMLSVGSRSDVDAARGGDADTDTGAGRGACEPWWWTRGDTEAEAEAEAVCPGDRFGDRWMAEFYYKEGSPASCSPRGSVDEPGFLDVLDEHGARYVSGLRRPPSKFPVGSGTYRFEVYIETGWMSALTLRGWFAVAGFPEVTIRRASADERTRLKCISKDGLAPGAELDCNDATLLDPASKRLLHKTKLFDNPSDRWTVTVNGRAYVPPLIEDGRKRYRSVEDLLRSRLASLTGSEYSMARVDLPDGRSVVRANVWMGRLVKASVLLAALTGKMEDGAGFNHSSLEIERVPRLDVMPDLDSEGAIKDDLITNYPDVKTLRPPTPPAAPLPEGGVDPGVSDTIVESGVESYGPSSGPIRPFGTLEYLHWQDVVNEYDRFESTTDVPLLRWGEGTLRNRVNPPEWVHGLVWDVQMAEYRAAGSPATSYGELRAKWPTDDTGAGAWDGDEEKWRDPEAAARLVERQYGQAYTNLLKELNRLADEWYKYLRGKYRHLYVQDEDADHWSWQGKYPCDDVTENRCARSLRSGIIPILWDTLRRESRIPGEGFDFQDPRGPMGGKNPWVTMLDRDQPTTAWCPKCGRRTKHDTSQRTFRCRWCGYEAPRDKHAARNMIILGQCPIPSAALKHGYDEPIGDYQYKPEDQRERAAGTRSFNLGSLVALHIGNDDDEDEDWDF
ncbi:hypothetical protein EMO89_00300 [Bifidobacterium tissieri]|uniref:Cas12f1-like TNB domain-containing protein n=1 Tax=Bifidobacterium tissieri TaxID=1630162 RepID=A0A5M9ZWL0_9BIFI|nr:zinc ribbon domain-containing protein [Bifidobacterium tissieri]KAA8832004.1 hypothetical protein EMO89_00300 [Bifidobacterium tissieri]